MNKLIDIKNPFHFWKKKTLLVRVSEAMDMYKHDSAEYMQAQTTQLSRKQKSYSTISTLDTA